MLLPADDAGSGLMLMPSRYHADASPGISVMQASARLGKMHEELAAAPARCLYDFCYYLEKASDFAGFSSSPV